MRTRWLIWLGLSSITILAYWDVWSFEFINFDDPQYVTERPQVLAGLSRESIRWAWTTTAASNWHPLTWMSLMLDVSLFGVGPGGLHFTNLVLHLLNTILVFEFFHRVTGFRIRSACIAALFAIHPVHAESVAWISERKDVLSTFFVLLTLRVYAEYVLSRDRQWYFCMLVMFVLAMLAKQTLVTLPCLLLVLDVWPLGRLSGTAANGCEVDRPGVARLAWDKVPLFLISAAFCITIFSVQNTSGAVKTASLLSRVANASLAYLLYLKSLVIPAGLALFYPRQPISNPWLLIGLSATVLAVISAAGLLLRKRAGWLLTGWLWFLGTMVPVSGIIQIGHAQRADRYLYVPAIGIYLALVWAVATGFNRLQLSQRGRIVITGMGLLMLLAVSFSQTRTWRSSVHVWTHATQVTAENGRSTLLLGMGLKEAGRLEEAEKHCIRAMALDPKSEEAAFVYGNVLFMQQRFPEAVESYQLALELLPEYAEAHVNLAVARWAQDQLDAAEKSLRQAVDLNPDYVPALYYLGRLLSETDRRVEAKTHLMRASRLDPLHRRVQFELRELTKAREPASS